MKPHESPLPPATSDPCCLAGAPLHAIRALMSEAGTDTVAVVDDHRRLLGLVTLEDLNAGLRAAALGRRLTARDVLRQPPTACGPTEPPARLRALMHRHGLRRMPLTDRHGRYVGMAALDRLQPQPPRLPRMAEVEFSFYVEML